jgi:hypothetical protein
MEIGVGFQGENDEVSRLQWLDEDVEILIAAADPGRCLTQELVKSLQMVQDDALVGKMKSMGVSFQGAFKLDRLAIVIRKSGGNGAIHDIQ